MAHSLGTFEEAALLAVFRLRDTAYGRTIHDDLTERLDRHISMGAMYNTLDRLERDGFVSSKVVKGPGGPGGRSRRYYKIQGAGVAALNQTRESANNIWADLSWPLAVR